MLTLDTNVAPAELLLGDEAVAAAAVDAGITAAFAYPGTPATEIFETIQAFAPQVWAKWSTNEKVAYEEALGVSYIGKRAIVSMKHVGLNVAADPFMSSALTGANGGLVLVVADDPGMHSSQNEQDSRFYAEFAKIPCFEPSNQQECYDMTREAFRWSETFHVPVMLRLVTRLAHSRAIVRRSPCESVTQQPLPDRSDWTLVPANAKRRFHHLLGLQRDMQDASENSAYNFLRLAGRRGIICSSTALNYIHEALGADIQDSILHIGVYPIPENLVRKLVDHCEEIVVIEEGYPFIEQRIKGFFGIPGKAIKGKLDGTLTLDGELLPELVANALAVPTPMPFHADALASPRPPQFCSGCPHAFTYSALVDAIAEHPEALFFSDIGCYALGLMPPFRAVHSCVDMGASIGMAHGASRAGAHPVICTIGDSTFAHSGMTALLDAVVYDANITVLIMDNATVAMTGTQDSMATGEQLDEILRGLGVKDLHIYEPLPKKHVENVETVRKAIAHQGLSVIVSRRPCIYVKGKGKPLPQSGA